jgi:hypothetical protein
MFLNFDRVIEKLTGSQISITSARVTNGDGCEGEFVAGATLPFKSLPRIRAELESYREWFNRWRPHGGLRLRIPADVHEQRPEKKRLNPEEGERFRLEVDYVSGHRSLPIYRLRRAA